MDIDDRAASLRAQMLILRCEQSANTTRWLRHSDGWKDAGEGERRDAAVHLNWTRWMVHQGRLSDEVRHDR